MKYMLYYSTEKFVHVSKALNLDQFAEYLEEEGIADKVFKLLSLPIPMRLTICDASVRVDIDYDTIIIIAPCDEQNELPISSLFESLHDKEVYYDRQPKEKLNKQQIQDLTKEIMTSKAEARIFATIKALRHHDIAIVLKDNV